MEPAPGNKKTFDVVNDNIVTELIEAAVAGITERWPQADKDQALRMDVEIEVCSGGERQPGKEKADPVLCISRELAIKLWRDHVEAKFATLHVESFRIVDGPHIDRWRITVTDAQNMHRIAEDRFSVTAKIVASLKKNNNQASSKPKRKAAQLKGRASLGLRT